MMIQKIRLFFSYPFYQKIYFICHLYDKVKTKYVYRYLLKKCGKNVIVKKPLFWTPEKISIGNNVYIWVGSRIEGISEYSNEKYNPHIIIGDNVSIQQSCHITAANELRIGNNTTISFGVSIQDSDHEYQQINVNILKQLLVVKKTIIGDNCFIGSGAKILAGTILGRQCIVGSNAVVRGVYPDYCVIAGVPAKIIKQYNHKMNEWVKVNTINK